MNKNTQSEIDFILDQISDSGYDSLSNKQKIYLDKFSKGELDKFIIPTEGMEYTSNNNEFIFRFDDMDEKDNLIIFNGELEIEHNTYYGSIIFNSDDGSFFSCDFSDEHNNMLEDCFLEDELKEICGFLATLIQIRK